MKKSPSENFDDTLLARVTERLRDAVPIRKLTKSGVIAFDEVQRVGEGERRQSK